MTTKQPGNTLLWIAWAVVSASVVLMILAARPTAPTMSIGLSYDVSKASVVEAKDTAYTKWKRHKDTQRAAELIENRSLSELGRMPPSWDRESEEQELRDLAVGLKESDADQLHALRADFAHRTVQALTGKLPMEEAERVLGGTIEKLRLYGLASDNRLVAPRFVIRTFAKARINTMLSLAPTEGFTAVEKHAHYGWPAFHATKIPAAQRLLVLSEYEKSKGRHAKVMRAQLHAEGGISDHARTAYHKLFLASGNVRYRNHALFIQERDEKAKSQDARPE